MIAWLVAAAGAAAAIPSQSPQADSLLAGASRAIVQQRTDQARMMIARAVANGASGRRLDRVLADLAFAQGHYAEALAGYQLLFKTGQPSGLALQNAGIAALRVGRPEIAQDYLKRAVTLPGPNWRTWNALGVASDQLAAWNDADAAYARAIALAPAQSEPVNNQGWSLMLRGSWDAAARQFRRALELDPKSVRASNNFDLVTAAGAAELPARRSGESDEDWAARLNDTGVTAALLGHRSRAIAAFSQALEARSAWYARAANNLDGFGLR